MDTVLVLYCLIELFTNHVTNIEPGVTTAMWIFTMVTAYLLHGSYAYIYPCMA